MMKTFLDNKITLHGGDSRDILRTIADASIDSVVTDPPYALVSIGKRFGKGNSAACKPGKTGAYQRASAGFMGKTWDTGETAFAVEFWAEVMRVLKPGGHVVAFSGTRTYHRLACAIEDAGFEIRDMLSWLYGTGFPKSHDVSKGIDKAAGAERTVTRERYTVKRFKPGATVKKEGAWGKQDVSYTATDSEPATDEAHQWQGWGTALKPSCEPIVFARKPLVGTVAENVLEHGTGAINVDGCRVPTDDALGGGMVSMGRPKASDGWDRPWMHDPVVTERKKGESADKVAKAENLGRWPANVVHDGSDEVTDIFGRYAEGAARFFYSAKADTNDRIGSKHPTVKPVDLMQWLCRLVTPPGGVVLDPFAGTGTTGEAAWREGFSAILIEREAEYQADIERRMKYALGGPEERSRAIIKAKGKVEDAGPLFANDNQPKSEAA